MHALLLLLACGGDPPARKDPADADETGTADADDTGDSGGPADTSCTPVLAWADADGDGYGAGDGELVCDTAGRVLVGGDCDDADADVSPAAQESCDDVDDDCDGATDEGLDAVEDACGDGVDANCDGIDPTCADWSAFATVADGAARIVGGVEDERFGEAVLLADLDGDDLDDVIVGAREYYGRQGGRVYLYRSTTAGDLTEGDADRRLTASEPGDAAGTELAAADFDGDGAIELAVGADESDAGGDNGGAVYVIADALSAGDLDGGTTWTGAEEDMASQRLATGDTDADGLPDLLVGSRLGDWGAIHALPRPGAASGTLADLSGRIVGDASLGAVGGMGFAAGDVDGDGIDDYAVGSVALDLSVSGLGAVYLMPGPLTGEASITDAVARAVGEHEYAMAGTEVDLGDFDGDGLADLVVAAPAEDAGGDMGGAVYVVLDPDAASRDLEAADVRLLGAAGMQLGSTVKLADLDGDDDADLLIGCRTDGTEGSDYLWMDPPLGTSPIANATWRIRGDQPDALLGAANALGDADGDGLLDLLAGTPERGSLHDGAAWLLEPTP